MIIVMNNLGMMEVYVAAEIEVVDVAAVIVAAVVAVVIFVVVVVAAAVVAAAAACKRSLTYLIM